MATIEPVVIVGAGPAGVRAAGALVAAGLRPLLIDEGARAGGQIFRQPEAGRGAGYRVLYGSEYRRARHLHHDFEALRKHLDYRPRTLVWNAGPGWLELYDSGKGCSERLAWSRLILATGAMDRVIPLPGWTLPGTFTLGGAQTLLKAQGCLIGRRVVFYGTGPLLYWVALQYARAGAEVAAVLDTTPRTRQWRHLAGLVALPGYLAKGIGFIAALRARGVPVLHGVSAAAIEGSGGVTGFSLRHRGRRYSLACDAVAIGHGLRSEIALAELLEVPLSWHRAQQQWVPECDAWGRTAVSGVYLAGDGAGIGGAGAAALRGRLAAAALLADAGHCVARLKPAAGAPAGPRVAGPAQPRGDVPGAGRRVSPAPPTIWSSAAARA